MLYKNTRDRTIFILSNVIILLKIGCANLDAARISPLFPYCFLSGRYQWSCFIYLYSILNILNIVVESCLWYNATVWKTGTILNWTQSSMRVFYTKELISRDAVAFRRPVLKKEFFEGEGYKVYKLRYTGSEFFGWWYSEPNCRFGFSTILLYHIIPT